MMKRRDAREAVLKLLFQQDFMSEIDEEDMPTDEYVVALMDGIKEHSAEIDAVIQKRSEGWTLDRLYSVDRNLLRLAIFELSYGEDIPAEVVINEAVELAKKYGTDKSPAFINGVLDRVHKECIGG